MNIVSNFSDYYDKLQQYGVDKTIPFVRINKQHFKFDKMNVWQMNAVENELQDESLKKLIQNGELTNINYNYPPENERVFDSLKASFRSISNIDARRYNMKNKSNINRPNVSLESVYAVINAKVFGSHMILEEVERQELCMSHVGASFPYDIVKKNATLEDIYDFLRSKKERFQELTSYDKENVNDILLNSKNFEEYKTLIETKKIDTYNSWYFRQNSKYNDRTKKITEKDLNAIHKSLESPIFFVTSSNNVVANLPLNYFGLTKLFDGNVEQLYQEIAYCIGNTIKDKNEPPVAISDLDKVVQHGFDKKISFRNRG